MLCEVEGGFFFFEEENGDALAIAMGGVADERLGFVAKEEKLTLLREGLRGKAGVEFS